MGIELSSRPCSLCSRFAELRPCRPVPSTYKNPDKTATPDATVKEDSPIKDRDGFADRRMEGLRSYLESLASQVQTLAQDQVLEKMLGENPESGDSGEKGLGGLLV